MPVKDLCIKIARCTQLGVFPCDKIASVQSNCILKQMPEPWNGHLATAEIMFIGSNPSIDFDEYFPNIGWDNDDIYDFFEDRFKNGKIVKSTGKKASVRYWNSLKKYIIWIHQALQSASLSEEMTIDENIVRSLIPNIVSTEIVHCKSKGEYGVSECQKVCFDKWMDKIFSEFKNGHGKYVILLGKKAHSFEKKIQSFPSTQGIRIIKLPHPSARVSNKRRIIQIRQAFAPINSSKSSSQP